MAMIATNPSRTLTAALRPTGLPKLPLVSALVAVWKEAANKRALRRLPRHLLRDIGLSHNDIALLKSSELPRWG